MLNEISLDTEEGRSFVKQILPFLDTYDKVKITSREYYRIFDIVISHLNLRSKFELSDRHEGRAYLNLKISRTMASVAIRRILNLDAIDFDALLHDKGFDLESINILGERFTICAFEFGSMPKIKQNFGKPIILVLTRPQLKVCYICGVAKNFSSEGEYILSSGFPEIVPIKHYLGTESN